MAEAPPLHRKSNQMLVGTLSLVAAAAASVSPYTGQYEGARLKPYHDPVGILTVCYGETNVPMHPYTLAQCNAMLAQDLAGPYGRGVAKCIPMWDPKRKQALGSAIDSAYNAGVGAFCRSPAAAFFREGLWEDGCQALTDWRVTARGVKLAGLARRRREDAKRCEEIDQ